MEEFEYLNSTIDKLIDKHIVYQKNNTFYTEEGIKMSINLTDLENYKFEDEEIQYVMDYLKKRDIYVLGSSPAVYRCFDNYRYVRKPKTSFSSIKLPEDKQIELIRKFKETSDIKYRNTLVESYIDTVKQYTIKYASATGIDKDELSSYGYEGLILAINKLDLSKNVCKTYILNMIHKHILIGVSLEQGFKNDDLHIKYVKSKKQVMLRHKGDNLSEYDLLDEIVDEIFKDEAGYDKCVITAKNRIYANYATSLDSQEIIDEDIENQIIENILTKKRNAEINRLLTEKLTNRQMSILTQRFGLNNKKPLLLTDLAEKENITPSCVDITIKRTINKIKKDHKLLKKIRNLYD